MNKNIEEESYTTLDNKQVQIPSKNGTILHFWAYNNPLSRSSLRYLKEINEKANKRNIEVVVVCLSWAGSENEIRSYAKNENFNFKLIFDKNNTFASKFNVTSVPQTQIIQKNGVLTHRLIGLREDIDYVDEIVDKVK